MPKGDALLKLFDDYVVIQSPYHEKFIAELKETIPPEDRMWVPEDKVWEVSGDFWEEVHSLMCWYFDVRVEVVDACWIGPLYRAQRLQRGSHEQSLGSR